MRLSYSAVGAWRQCQQKYDFSYRQRLRPRVQSAALSQGSLIHSYMEYYYQLLRQGEEAGLAHADALELLRTKHVDELKSLVRQAWEAGEEDLAREYAAMLKKVEGLCDQYYEVRGKEDADHYEIILVEQSWLHNADDGVQTPLKLDLYTEDKETGKRALWDHKSSVNQPDRKTRLLDLQLVLYAAVCDERGFPVEEFVWNYVRTVLPNYPKINKDGTVSKAACDTTWQIMYDTIVSNGQDPADYEEQLKRLEGKETEVYFPRFHQPLAANEALIIQDYLKSAAEIRRAYSIEGFQPIKNVGTGCNWCDFRKLCEAAIVGGDPQDIAYRHFRTNKGKAPERVAV